MKPFYLATYKPNGTRRKIVHIERPESLLARVRPDKSPERQRKCEATTLCGWRLYNIYAPSGWMRPELVEFSGFNTTPTDPICKNCLRKGGD